MSGIFVFGACISFFFNKKIIVLCLYSEQGKVRWVKIFFDFFSFISVRTRPGYRLSFLCRLQLGETVLHLPDPFPILRRIKVTPLNVACLHFLLGVGSRTDVCSLV